MKNTMTHMRRLFIGLTLAAALASLCWQPLAAFTQLTSTTLSTAVTSESATTIVVASATGIAVNTTALFVDWEYMTVSGVSGTTITVRRGSGGTRAALHVSGATVLIGNPNAFTSVDPAGGCTIANVLYQPVVNIRNGNWWLCRGTQGTATGTWQATNVVNIVYNSTNRTP
jgi:hypothetical protein